MDIRKGDTVKITGSRIHRRPLQGKVKSVDLHYVWEDGIVPSTQYYIEIEDEQTGYEYWKQPEDGGEVEVVHSLWCGVDSRYYDDCAIEGGSCEYHKWSGNHYLPLAEKSPQDFLKEWSH